MSGQERDHDFYEEALAAWVLGALPDLEAEVVERHVARCERCAAEAQRLRPVVDALGSAVPPHHAPRSLRRDVMAQVRGEAEPRPVRRRLLRPALVPALALALGVLVLAGVGISDLSSDPVRTVPGAVDAQRLDPAAQARLEIVDGGDVALLHVAHMPALSPGRVYELWVQRDHRVLPAGTFTVDRQGRGSAEVQGGVQGVRAVMVTRERRGGTSRPTEAPVVTITV